MYVKHVPLGSNHSELHAVIGRLAFGRAELEGNNPSFEQVLEAIDEATESMVGDPDALELRLDPDVPEDAWYIVRWAQFHTPSSDGEKLLVTSGQLFIMGDDGGTVERV